MLRYERIASGSSASAATVITQSPHGAWPLTNARRRTTISAANASVAAQNSTPKKLFGSTGNHSSIRIAIERAVESITKR